MASFNKLVLVGNLTGDPELRYTPQGKAVASFRLAVNDPYDENETVFIEIEVWEKRAENCAKYLKKGSPALVEGRLRMNTWEDKTTKEKRSKLFCTAIDVQFLGRKPEGADSGASEEPPPAPPAPAAPKSTRKR
ncbi:single-stranded DNA-binding protein [Oleiharenicola sp. Vm1]|uniref:single-stranded DNA-binding protein n=1 Tax=Oleiharenicola sp. Vm1 TaxID=3398393 RepID=UPI0039F44AD4